MKLITTILILCLLTADCFGGSPAYPIKVSNTNPRILADQNNNPWMMVGDSPQALVVNLAQTNAAFFIADRATNNFNALVIDVICTTYTGGPANAQLLNGTLPFKGTISGGYYDLTTPNPAYFSYVDTVVNMCASNGIVAILDPIETDGWLPTMLANGSNACLSYGEYLGSRYKGFTNIIWQSGNDFQDWSDSGDDAVVLAVAKGIENEDTNHIQTIELSYYLSSSLDDNNWSNIVNVNLAYTYYPTYDEVLHAYGQSASIPVFMGEANYELETNGSADGGSPQILRLQEYWTMLSGASGQCYGNHYTWQFIPNWQTYLDTVGVTQLVIMSGLFNSVQWYDLVPDTNHTFVTSGYGTYDSTGSMYGNNYVTAAMATNGTLGIAYIPITNAITVAMSKFAGPVTAQWFDPSDSNYLAVSGSPFSNSGSQTFTPAKTNSVGGTDWVLLLKAQAVPPVAPKIKAVGLSSGGFIVSFSTVLGQNYQLQGTTNLAGGSWVSLGTSIPGTGAIVQITNTVSQFQQVYRVVTAF